MPRGLSSILQEAIYSILQYNAVYCYILSERGLASKVQVVVEDGSIVYSVALADARSIRGENKYRVMNSDNDTSS